MAGRTSRKRRTVAIALSLVFSGALYIGYTAWRLNPSQARIDRAHEKLEAMQADSLAALAAHVESAQPAGENAWPKYERLLTQEFGYLPDRPDRSNENWLRLQRAIQDDPFHGDWSDPHFDACREALAAIDHLLPMLDAAADTPGFSMPYMRDRIGSTGDLMLDRALSVTLLYPRLGQLRQLARWNALAMRSAAEDERWDDVERRLKTGLSMARHLSLQSTMIESIISSANMHIATSELRRLVIEHNISAERCASMLEILRSHPWPLADLAHALVGEEILLRDTADSMMVSLWLHRASTRLARTTEQNIESMMLHTREHWTLSPGGRIDDFQSPQGVSDSFVFQMLPAYGGSLGSIRRSVSEQHALAVLIRLRAYHARHGRWPERLLDAMTPEEATNPVLGIPLEYALHGAAAGNGSSSGTPFTLTIPLPPEFADEHLWEAPIDVTAAREPLPPEVDDDW